MKRIISIAAAVAMIFGAASCQKDIIPGLDGDCKVTFGVVIPDDVVTKAISDGLTVDELKWEVYDHDNNKKLYSGTVGESVIVNNKRQFVLELNLVSNLTYDLLFWAQKKGTNYYNTDNLKDVRAYYNENYPNSWNNSHTHAYANDEARDAFFGSLKEYQTGGNVATEKTVILKRPFAQINFASSPSDWERAKPFINDGDSNTAHHGLESQITLENMYTHFNVFTGDVTGEANRKIVFKYALAPASKDGNSYNNDLDNWITYEGAKFGWAAMNYVFAPLNGATSNSLVAEFVHSKNAKDETALKKTILSVPFKQNYRTNILGEIFTGGNKFTIIVDGSFNNPDPGYTLAEPLMIAFENGGNITLNTDVELSSALILKNKKKLTLDLNGHTITAAKDFWSVENSIWSIMSVQGGAQLTIVDSKGTGAIVAKENDSYVFDVRDGSTLNIEGGRFVGNISAVYVKQGTANIKGGHYSIMQLSEPANGSDERFTLNCYDENYQANPRKANIVVTGGSFVNFDPSLNLAEGEGTNFVPTTGYQVSHTAPENGKTTYIVSPVTANE
jgi:hypothetical protein